MEEPSTAPQKRPSLLRPPVTGCLGGGCAGLLFLLVIFMAMLLFPPDLSTGSGYEGFGPGLLLIPFVVVFFIAFWGAVLGGLMGLVRLVALLLPPPQLKHLDRRRKAHGSKELWQGRAAGREDPY